MADKSRKRYFRDSDRKIIHNNTKKYKDIKLAQIENNKIKTTVRKRNPGIDLARILGMWSIIINHILLHGQAIKKFKYKILTFMNICSFWHVNSYALVSGIVGYKTNKYSNLMYLWFWVLFYQVGIHYYFIINKKYKNINPSLYKSCFPVIFLKYWYFTQYFGMYLFLPTINRGLSYLTKKEHKIFLFSIYGIFIIWNNINHSITNVFGLNDGYSFIWLIISYFTGAFIGKYKNNYIEKKKFIAFPILIIIFIFSTIACFRLKYYQTEKLKDSNFKKIIIILKNLFKMRINSVPMILQSISLVLLVMNIPYNKYIGKIICFFGPLTFGIYLIHDNELIRGIIIRNLFAKESSKLSQYMVVKLVIYKSIFIFFICSFIDYLRFIIFQYLFRIKNICILIEKKIIKL